MLIIKSSVSGMPLSRSFEEQCGAMIRFGTCHSGSLLGSGSGSNASSTAPESLPERSPSPSAE
ncbi:hypothetical protein [Siccirubricoccus soli]|uniref:hypothetical protein n=1 Tax=Siccirubricoccus soli TaxID=2899147 RepID=UPI00209465A2|nr:hypothetical protein [Siccirubricoccus soli]